MADITLITATGDRPEALALCERYMLRQTFKGRIQWLVIDDGQVSCIPSEGQEYLRREPSAEDRQPTLALNILTLLPFVESDKILFIEDDDWYAPEYISYMFHVLDNVIIAGEGNAIYYNVKERKYYKHGNTGHASLCQTGLRFNEDTRKLLQEILNTQEKFIDILLWQKINGVKRLVNHEQPFCVGIKGMPGRKGIGTGHNPNNRYVEDFDMIYLEKLIGSDKENYGKYFSRTH